MTGLPQAVRSGAAGAGQGGALLAAVAAGAAELEKGWPRERDEVVPDAADAPPTPSSTMYRELYPPPPSANALARCRGRRTITTHGTTA